MAVDSYSGMMHSGPEADMTSLHLHMFRRSYTRPWCSPTLYTWHAAVSVIQL